MNLIDIDSVRDDQLVDRYSVAKYMGITAQHWDRWVNAGKAVDKVTPDGIYPKWRAGDIRELRQKYFEYGILPTGGWTTVVDISDPCVDDGEMCTREACAKFLGITAVTWDRWVKTGVAPKAYKLPGFRPKWRVGEVRKTFRR